MGTHPIFESDFDCLTVQRVEIGMASAIDELLAQFPEMDPVLLKCIKFLQIGGKEGRKGIKDMTNEIFTTRSTSPLAAAQAKRDNRKRSRAWSWTAALIQNQVQIFRLDLLLQAKV